MINKFKLKKNKNEKKKKGFTLVELLAVIVILAIIMVITIPTVLGSMSGAKEKAEEVFIKEMEKALKNYIDYEIKVGFNSSGFKISDKPGNYQLLNVYKSDNESITFNDLINKGYIKESNFKSPKTDKKCNKNEIIDIYKEQNSDTYYYYASLECVNYILKNLSIPEEPNLTTGLIPVVYDENNISDNGTGWFVADISSDWYNYYKQKWANGVLVTKSSKTKYYKNNKYQSGVEIQKNDLLAMFVWIPRFSYTIGCADLDTNGNINRNVTTDYSIVDPSSQVATECLGYRIDGASKVSLSTPGAIDIKFISTDQIDPLKNGKNPNYDYYLDEDFYPKDSRTPDNWLTHPAFSFDNNSNGTIEANEEISGFWFGKFETTGTTPAPTILPGENSISTDLIYAINATKKFFNNKDYGFSNTTTSDIHVTKSSEWAAVTYLSQSKYGKYGNSLYNNEYKEVYNNNGYVTGFSSGNPPKYSKNEESFTQGFYQYNRMDGANGPIGTGASTTGNIYGVYDMSGGRSEKVLGNYELKVGASDDSTQLSNWLFTIQNAKYSNFKYLDIYTENSTLSDIKYRKLIRLSFKINNNTIYKNIPITTIGHGLYETKNWYQDSSIQKTSFSNSGDAWFHKGGDRANAYHTGIFCNSFGKAKNNIYQGFRITYIPYIK